MKSVLKGLRRAPVKFLVRVGWIPPVVWLCCRFVKRLEIAGATGPVVLAVNPARFRGDLEVLAYEQGFRIRVMSLPWQSFLYTCFYQEKDGCLVDRDVPRIAAAQAAYRVYLRKFLPRLYRALGVQAVIGAALHYRQDYDIVAVSHEIGIPAVILHREGNLGSDAVRHQFVERYKMLGQFHGTKLSVHNAIQKNLLIETGFATADQVIVGGNVRMDKFVHAVRSGQYEGRNGRGQNGGGRVTMFSFGPGTGNYQAKPPNWPLQPEKYLLELCRDAHCTVARFAWNHPEIDVVIKAKWGGGWISNVEKLLDAEGLHPRGISNLSVVGDGNAQEMMAQSDVVIAFGSTTLLESAAMGRATIMPYFHEAATDRMAEFVFYREGFDCFDLARSPEEMERMIESRLSGFTPSPKLTSRRIELFEKYVSYWDASATEKCVSTLMALINEAHAPDVRHTVQ